MLDETDHRRGVFGEEIIKIGRNLHGCFWRIFVFIGPEEDDSPVGYILKFAFHEVGEDMVDTFSRLES